MRRAGLVVLAAAMGCSGSGPRDGTVRQAAGGGASAWVERTPTSGNLNPVGRLGAAMAFDPVRRRAVLLSGRSAFASGQTYEWDSDSRTWFNLGTGAPNLRDHRMAYFDGAIVAYGGRNPSNDTPNGDVLKYDGSAHTWTSVAIPGTLPLARWGHGLAVVPGTGLVIEGGTNSTTGLAFDDTWILPSLTDAWQDASGTPDQRAPARSGHAFFYDGAKLVLFGGTVTTDGGDAGVATTIGDDTWTGAIASGQVVWSSATSGQPGARSDSPAAFYPPFANAVLFSDGSAADTWLYGGGWSLDAPSGAPPPRTGQAMTYDSSRRVVLLFGGGGLADTWEYHIDAKPVITAPAQESGTEAAAVSFDVSASDADGGETVDLELTSIQPVPPSQPVLVSLFPAASGTGSASGTFGWTPGCRDHGDYTLTFSATDGVNDVTATTHLTISDADCPPVFAPINPPGFATGVAGSFTVSATDPDGDTVTYTLDALVPAPQVAPTLNGTTGVFSWTPGAADAGNYSATFHAHAAGADVPATVMLSVTSTNQPPMLVLPPPQAFIEGSTGFFTVSATDPDGDPVTLAFAGISPMPMVAPSFAPATGSFTWTPGFFDAGTYTASFSAADASHPPVTGSVTIVVADTDRPPVITPIPPQTVAEGHLLTFTVSASDPDGQTLIYSAPTLPAGATFDATSHVFRWTPACNAADNGGATSARFKVSDGQKFAILDVSIGVTGTVLRLSPTSLSFPTTTVGAAATPLALTLTNGSASTPFTVLTVAVSDPAFSTTVPTSLPAPLAPGGMLALGVGFYPVAAASYSATVTVTIDDPICGTATVPVFGVGQNAGVQVSRSGADFGQVRLGTTSAAADFTVTNSGATSFTIESIALSETADFTLTLTLPTSYPVLLAPGYTATFSVAARPTQLGLLTGQVAVNTDVAGAGTTLLPIEVVGVAPGLAVSEDRIDFGAVDLRGPPAMHALTLTNFGTTTLTVGQPALTGPGAANYDVAGIDASGLLLDPGLSATAVVLFHPVTEGTIPAAALQLTSDAPDQPSIVVLLAGRGIDRHLDVAPGSLGFPATRVGVAATKTLVVTNGGEAPLVFGSPAARAGAPFTVGGAPAQLAAGASATLTVTFTPTAVGPASVDLVLVSDDAAQPMLHVALSGSGISADLLTEPAALDIGTVVVGGSRSMELVVENSAASTTHMLTGICIADAGQTTCGGAADFRLGGTAATAIGPHGRVTLDVVFTPQAAGASSATLLIFSDGGSQPTLIVALSGAGTDDVRLSGGGCAVAGNGGSGLVIVLLLLTLLRRRAWMLVVVVIGTAGSAAADGSFNLDVFRPTTVPGSALITVERPEVLPDGTLGFAATFDYARNPLYALSGSAREAPVSDRGAMTLTVAYGLGGAVELAASLPVIVESGSADMTGVPAASGAGIGDAVVEGRLRLVPGTLAAALLLGLPTGDGDRYDGAGGVAGELRVVAGTTLGGVRLAADAGLRLRSEARLGPVAQGNAVSFGAGAAVRLAERVDALGEVYGAVGLSGDLGAASPVEALLGLRVRAAGVVVTAGGGAGLQSGIGAADLRLFAGLAFAVGGSRPAAPPPSPPPSSPPPPPPSLPPPPPPPPALPPPPPPEDLGETAILLTPDRIELLVPLHFRGAELAPASRPILAQVASALRAHPDIAHLVVAVHIEPTRYPDRDRQLAEQRGAAIRAALVDKGVAAGRIEVNAVGSARPLKKGLSERVELLIR